MKFIKLTLDYNSKPVFVNVASIISIYDNDGNTGVTFGVGEDGYYVVKENAQQIMEMIG